MTSYMVSLMLVNESHTTWIQAYASDPQISATCNVPYPYPENGAELFVRVAMEGERKGTQYVFAIYTGDDFAGLVTLNGIDEAAGTAALDYWIAVPFWGRGIGGAAAKLAVQYAFDKLKLSRLHSGCLVRNPASARVLEKCGFRETEGIIHDGAGSGRFTGEPIRLFEMAQPDSNKPD